MAETNVNTTVKTVDVKAVTVKAVKAVTVKPMTKTTTICDIVGDPFEYMLDYVDFVDILAILKVSKSFYRICVKYLQKKAHRTAFIVKQNDKLVVLKDRLSQIQQEIEKSNKILEWYGKFDGHKPDALVLSSWDYWRQLKEGTDLDNLVWIRVSIMQLLKNKPELLYANGPKTVRINKEKTAIYVKSGLSTKKIRIIKDKFQSVGWIQTMPNKTESKCDRIGMVFVSAFHNFRKSWNGCRECGDILHTVYRCPNAICSYCKLQGHVSVYCPTNKCKVCATVGHDYRVCEWRHCVTCGGKGHTKDDCKLKLRSKKSRSTNTKKYNAKTKRDFFGHRRQKYK